MNETSTILDLLDTCECGSMGRFVHAENGYRVECRECAMITASHDNYVAALTEWNRIQRGMQ
jgi:hypothetical protein